MPAAPATIPTAPIHLLRIALFAIATPKIISTAPEAFDNNY